MDKETVQTLPSICPDCRAIDAKTTDEETYAPLIAEVCSKCGYVYDFTE